MERSTTRHYGLDWLRIGAFALLILYHVGMFFVPWDWHVKTARPLDWVTIPMFFTNSWRLALLFVVSGYASAVLLTKQKARGAFVRDRSARLIIPTVFAMILIIPPQPWVELMVKYSYPYDLVTFWQRDYFRFDELNGLKLPTWQHLWFVVYLWVYTLILGLLAAGPKPWARRLFDRLFGGVGLLLIPLGWAMFVTFGPIAGGRVTHGLFDDLAGHLIFVPAFAFGVGLAHSGTALSAARRWWIPAAMLALTGYGITIAVELQWPGNQIAPPGPSNWMRFGRMLQGWTMIVALLGIADRYWNVDHRWRATLTEAVFPFYIIHQTIIVWLGWWLLRFGVAPLAEFLILVIATVAGCTAFYVVGRSVGWLRPLIGLRSTAQEHQATPSASRA